MAIVTIKKEAVVKYPEELPRLSDAFYSVTLADLHFHMFFADYAAPSTAGTLVGSLACSDNQSCQERLALLNSIQDVDHAELSAGQEPPADAVAVTAPALGSQGVIPFRKATVVLKSGAATRGNLEKISRETASNGLLKALRDGGFMVTATILPFFAGNDLIFAGTLRCKAQCSGDLKELEKLEFVRQAIPDGLIGFAN